MQDEILIGAGGQMFSLAIPENGNFTENPVKFGNTKRGISGAATVDVQGARSEYTWSAEDLNEDDCSLLRQVYSQIRAANSPVRLFLPHRKNLLTASASSARSVAPARAAITHYQSLLGISAVTTPAVDRPDVDTTYPLFPRLTRYIHAVNSGGDSDYLYPEGNPNAGTTSPVWTRVPLIEGRQYTLSVLYRITTPGTGTNSASYLRYGWRRADGFASGTPTVTPATLTASDWTWQSVTVTIPTGWPGFFPVIENGNSSVMDIAAMQLEESATRTPWVIGSGVPVVSLSSLQFTDSLWPLRNASLSMIEL